MVSATREIVTLERPTFADFVIANRPLSEMLAAS